MKDVMLSKNFWLSEFLKSDTAERHGITNWPIEEHLQNDITERLRNLCINVLQPVRNHFNKPVKINSGYRCLELNRLLGSDDNSQHVFGLAADYEILDVNISNYELASYVRDNLIFDQLILEFHNPKIPNSGWVHTSYVFGKNRGELLTIRNNQKTGFVERLNGLVY